METLEEPRVPEYLPLVGDLVIWGVDALCAGFPAVLAWLLLIAPDLAAAARCADSPGHPGLCFFRWLLVFLLLLLILLLLLLVVFVGRVPCRDNSIAVCHDLIVGRGL